MVNNRLWQYFQWTPIFLERNRFVAFLLAIVITGCSTVSDSDPLQAVAVVYSEVITIGMLSEIEDESNPLKELAKKRGLFKKNSWLNNEYSNEQFRFRFEGFFREEIRKEAIKNKSIKAEDQRAAAEKILKIPPGSISMDKTSRLSIDKVPPPILEMANQSIVNWEFNKELYATYGGRVSNNGLPVDALLQHIEKMEKWGKIIFIDKKYRKSLFKYYRTLIDDEYLSENEAITYFDIPWWQKNSVLR